MNSRFEKLSSLHTVNGSVSIEPGPDSNTDAFPTHSMVPGPWELSSILLLNSKPSYINSFSFLSLAPSTFPNPG